MTITKDAGQVKHTEGPFGYVFQPHGASEWDFSKTRPDISQGAYWTVVPVYTSNSHDDLLKVLESCQRVLADLVGGDKSLSTINIYAQAVKAELKARAALSSSRSDQE